MAMVFEDLKVLQSAERIADDIWKQVSRWEKFARDVVGKQMARAADSVGANIAEAFGRFHYGEKLSFLYYARGSLFETKYWVNRSMARNLFPSEQAQEYANRLANLARQLNAFAATIKKNRYTKAPSNALKESQGDYLAEDLPALLFDENDLAWLQSHDPDQPHKQWNDQYPIPNTQ